MKPNIQTLYARILEEIRAEMDEAETLYLKLCRMALSYMVHSYQSAPASSDQEIEFLSGQYRKKLQTIIRDVSTVYRNPIQVYPVSDKASVLESMEI